MRGIITADWHLRKDKPRCRLDKDWIQTQKEALLFVFSEANRRKCDVYAIGDIFDTGRVDQEITNLLLESLLILKGNFYFLAGNHDLPFHSVDQLYKASIKPLFLLEDWKCKQIPKEYVGGSHFNQEIEEAEIMFIHTFAVETFKDKIMDIGITSAELFRKYPSAKWIFTGDNHHGFISERSGKTHINPGCLIRQTADLIDYQPAIYYVDTEKEVKEKINVPDCVEMVTDEYLKQEHARENRIEAFVEKIHSKTGLSLSFTDNVKLALKKVEPDVQKTVNLIFEKGGISL